MCVACADVTPCQVCYLHLPLVGSHLISGTCQGAAIHSQLSQYAITQTHTHSLTLSHTHTHTHTHTQTHLHSHSRLLSHSVLHTDMKKVPGSSTRRQASVLNYTCTNAHTWLNTLPHPPPSPPRVGG